MSHAPIPPSLLARIKEKLNKETKPAPATNLPAAPAPAPKVVEQQIRIPTPAPKPKWTAHNIPTPLHLLLAHRPKQKPYKWQAETLYQLAGYNTDDLEQEPLIPTDKVPFYYNLVAANGSGKDQIVIAAFATWFAMAKVRSRCIITSSSYEQLKDQTFKYIKTLCEDINEFHKRPIFEIVEFSITCNDTGSEIKCFVTDDPGKAEGRHPFDDYPGAEMAVIVNEAKSISDELFQAFSRFTGYNYWLEISSPGTTAGHFYKRCTIAEYAWPQQPNLGEFYWRRITAYDCDHLLGKHIENLKKEYGENSLIFRSQVLAEFTTLDEAAYISSTLFENYPKLAPRTFGLPNRGGIDLSLGGDEMCGYFFVGGKLYKRTVKHTRKGAVEAQIISWIKEFNLSPSETRVDDGGIGRPIIQGVQDAGYDIVPVRNEARSSNPNFYKNRGVENWSRIKRALEERVFPNIEDEETRKQLTTRGYKVTGIVVSLEKKAEMKARGLPSPDRADALALCFDGVPFSAFKESTPVEVSPANRFNELMMLGRQRGLNATEQEEFSTLFQMIAEQKRPAAQHSLDGKEPEENNHGLFHSYYR